MFALTSLSQYAPAFTSFDAKSSFIYTLLTFQLYAHQTSSGQRVCLPVSEFFMTIHYLKIRKARNVADILIFGNLRCLLLTNISCTGGLYSCFSRIEEETIFVITIMRDFQQPDLHFCLASFHASFQTHFSSFHTHGWEALHKYSMGPRGLCMPHMSMRVQSRK